MAIIDNAIINIFILIGVKRVVDPNDIEYLN
jgi:hypothetical protein